MNGMPREFSSKKGFLNAKLIRYCLLSVIAVFVSLSISLGEASAVKHQITVIQPPEGGKITRTGQTTKVLKVLVKQGTNAWFTLTPKTGFHLSAVTIDGNLIYDGVTKTDKNLTRIGTSKAYQYVFKRVAQPHTIAATFARKGETNLTLIGSLGTGYLPPGPVGAVYGLTPDKQVDKIVAIQSDRGYLGAYSMQYSRSANINDDGTFSISLDTGKDWVLVLEDSTAAAKTDLFVGYIALNAGTDGLLQIPATTSMISSLDLGMITASGDVGQSQNTINAEDFSMDAAQLLSLAKSDDGFKSVKNFVINYNQSTAVYYTLRPDFRWRGDYASINGAFQNPAGYTYSHYGFQLDSNTSTINMDKICGTNGQTKVIINLAPPSDVMTTDARTFGPGTPMSSANVICTPAADGFIEAQDFTGSGFYATNRYGGISQSYAATLSGTIPEGYWLYYEGEQQMGQFDVAVASPLGAGNEIKGFVPSIKVNTDPEIPGKITSVDIKWYSWDSSTSQYVELTDVSILQYLIGTGDVYFDNITDNIRTYESVHFDPAVGTSVTPSQYTWYYGADGPPNRQVLGFGIFYSSGGIGYFFEFFNPTQF